MNDLDKTLAERGGRYGPFADQAKITQELKATIRAHLDNKQQVLADDQQEALDMICSKIARTINGDPDYADNWVDIAGYAMLVAQRLATKDKA